MSRHGPALESVVSHMISVARGCSFAVVDMDGYVLSCHRTIKAAQTEIRREARRFHRRPGTAGAYLPRSVIGFAGYGREVCITRAAPYSTAWRIA